MGVGPPRLRDWSQLVPQPLCPASLPTVGPGQRNRWPGLCSQVCSRPTGPLGRVPLWREGSAASTADMGHPAAYRPTGKTGRGAWWAPGCSRPPSTSRRCRLLCPLGVSAGTRVTPLRSGPCPCPYPPLMASCRLPGRSRTEAGTEGTVARALPGSAAPRARDTVPSWVVASAAAAGAARWFPLAVQIEGWSREKRRRERS